jgi:CubicO group peptidase (beta-lactamase class C family)
MIDAVREALQPHVEFGRIPGYVAGVRSAEQSAFAAAGRLAAGSGPAMAPSTLFRIASLSKPVGAVVALSLVQDGTFALEDEVARWLPELASPVVLRTPDAPLDDTVSAERPILIRDLLTMTAGFGLVLGRSPLQSAMTEAGLMPGAFPPVFSPDEFMARLGQLPLARQPGQAWLYHTCADALAVLVTRASGRSCRDLVRERIAEPLNLTDLSFFTTDTARLATAYRPARPGLAVLDPPDGAFSQQPAFEAFGSGLLSTIPDYLEFQTMLLDRRGHILDADLADLMSRDCLEPSQRDSAQTFLGPGRSWGLMVEVHREPNDSELAPGSFGWMGGTGTTAYVDREHDFAAALFTQRAMESNRPTNVFKDFWRAVYSGAANPNAALLDA